MEEVTVFLPTGGNVSGDWWGGTDEEPVISLPLDASEGGLFNGHFVPPPPRPLFLDDSVTPDGLTTCDLCSWAWQNGNNFAIDATLDMPGELGWVLTLVIVSLISAIIGAIVMIVALHCRRMKNASTNDANTNRNPIRRNSGRPPINTPSDKTISAITPPTFPNIPTLTQNNHNGVWSWLSRRASSGPTQLDNIPSSQAENHYTHMEDTYNSVGEALYAELDRESSVDRDSNSSPAYQNSAYTDPDAQISSAPSSAYYSDLSVTTVPDRAYEVVGLVTMPNWENGSNERRPPARLASISENVSVPSDYV